MSGVILVVDDEPDICSELGLFLTQKGYQVHTAPNGAEGFDLFNEKKPDLVITDYKMPVMNGFDLMLKIKNSDRNVPVIIMSAVVDFKFYEKTQRSSGYIFLPKPVDNRKLLQILENALKG